MSIFTNNSFHLFILIVLYIVVMAFFTLLLYLLLYLPMKYPIFIVIYTVGFPLAMMRYYVSFASLIIKKVSKIAPSLQCKNSQNKEQSHSDG